MALALGLRIPLNPILDDRVPFITLFAVMLPLVKLVRAGPFLVVSLLGLMAAAFMFRHRLLRADNIGNLEVLLFVIAVLTATLTAWISQRAAQRQRQSEVEAQRQLRESEERFRVMADSAPVLIWMSGPDKLCTWFNKQWLTFVGRSMEQELGNGWAENVHPDDFQRCLDTYVRSFDARRPFSMEYRLKRHDGEYRWILDQGIPRYGRGDDFTGYIGSCIDITDRKQVEDERSQHARELAEALAQRTAEVTRAERALATSERMAAVGTLASGLAHDINNITLPLSLRLDPLLGGANLTDEQRTNLTVVVALLDHLRMMSKNLSLFTRDPDQEGMFGSTDLTAWCTNVKGLMEASLASYGRVPRQQTPYIRLNCEIPEGLPPLRIAPHRLSQAMLNLVHNARDAILTRRAHAGPNMPSGQGCISIQARPRDDGRAVFLCISDDGCGMPPEVTKRATEPFFTTKDRPSAAGASGSGMGLSLVQAICERVGGSLHIQSEIGKGTTITLTLPTVREVSLVDHTASKEPRPLAVS